MIKKYIPIVVIFVVSLIVIFFYLMRNIEITSSITKLSEVRNLAYELEILTHKQYRYIQTLSAESNYDEIVNINTGFEKRLQYFDVLIKSTNNIKLKKILYDMNQKRVALENIFEDIKTDNAVIKNSQAWLVKSYYNYLLGTQPDELDKNILLYIFNGITPYADDDSAKLIKIKSDILEVNKFNAHLKIIYDKRKSLLLLQENLKKYSLLKDYDKIILYSLRELNKLQEETESIIKILLASSVFLLLFGLFVYVREIINSHEMRKLKNELQQFVDALNESAIVSKTDVRGIITYVNEKFCELSGYKREDLIGFSHRIVRHPDMDANVFADLWSTIKNKKIFKATLQNKAKSGRAYFVDTAIIPLLDVEGEITEFLAVKYDVSSLVESRDAAILAEKSKSEFLSNISHELRTPLNAIHGFSAVLKRTTKDEKKLTYLKNIIDSSDNLIGLIDDILDLSKLQSGKFSLEYHNFNVMDKTKHLLERFDLLVERASLVMRKEIGIPTGLILSGDWLRISQIITNLMSNAIKFTSRDKEIAFGIEYTDSNLLIRVKDQGLGLSKEAQEKIFKPFEQADSSTTRKFGGTGLGLSIVLSLIEQMKGTIELESTEGVGSSFKVSIPLTESKYADKGEVINDELLEPLHGYVLIAEDNKTNQMLIKILMEEFGLDYKIANDGVEAVELFSKEKFNLVLMDENMPNLNGIDAMKKIHSLYGKDIPIVALTANAMSGDREKFLEAGMSGYVSKPIDDRELYRVIKNLLT